MGKDFVRSTADEQLLLAAPDDAFRHFNPWRVLRIQSEFVRGFDALADVRRGVTLFGSARTSPDDPMSWFARPPKPLLAPLVTRRQGKDLD